jgi:hypothetical protein
MAWTRHLIDQPTALSASQPRCGATEESPSSPAIQPATFALVHTPPSGGAALKRSRSRSSRSGRSTVATPPLRRRRSPSADGPDAL